MTAQPKYPYIYCGIDLDGPGGNIYAVIVRIRGELRNAGIDPEKIERFTAEVAATMSYERALQVCGQWVTMLPPHEGLKP